MKEENKFLVKPDWYRAPSVSEFDFFNKKFSVMCSPFDYGWKDYMVLAKGSFRNLSTEISRLNRGLNRVMESENYEAARLISDKIDFLKKKV